MDISSNNCLVMSDGKYLETIGQFLLKNQVIPKLKEAINSTSILRKILKVGE